MSHPQFLQELKRAERMIAGRIDSRFVGPAVNPLSEKMDYDPFFPAVAPAYTAAFLDYLHTPEASAAAAEGSGYKPTITGADALLSDVAKKNFQEAFPGDALNNLWPWPAEPTWYAEIRSQYADKFKAA